MTIPYSRSTLHVVLLLTCGGAVVLSQQVREGFDQVPCKQDKQSLESFCDAVSQTVEG